MIILHVHHSKFLKDEDLKRLFAILSIHILHYYMYMVKPSFILGQLQISVMLLTMTSYFIVSDE